MSKLIKCFFILVAISFLAGCVASFSESANTAKIKRVAEVKLASGKTAKVGWKQPQASWQCEQMGEQSYSPRELSMEGQFHFSGTYGLFQSKAVDYANEKKIDANYIWLFIPTQHSLGDIDLNLHSKATATYYRCKHTPALNDRMI